MELLSKEVLLVHEVTHVVQHPEEGPLFYKEWLDERGKCIDFVLRSKSGYSIDDPALIEEVQEFVDSLEE